jgi:hypothetical protein
MFVFGVSNKQTSAHPWVGVLLTQTKFFSIRGFIRRIVGNIGIHAQ